MRGNITRRGKASWRIKFDTGTADKRQYHIETVHGTKRDAEAVLAKRLGELVEGRYVKLTIETVIAMQCIGSRISRRPRERR